MANGSSTRQENRALVALCGVTIQLILGTVYAWSVFNKPLAVHGWSSKSITVTFELAIFFQGLSAALGGRFVDRAGARKIAMISAALFGLGTILAGVADSIGSLWLLWIGYGVIAGIGNGLGYITPIAVLVRWFPEKKGLITGMAVMGFGLGAALMSQIAPILILHLGVAKTFYISGVFYFVVMMLVAQKLNNPPAGWVAPQPAVTAKKAAAPVASVDFAGALSMPQFYILWVVLFLNISAGIALISNLSPIAQEQVGLGAIAAGTLVSVCSLFNGLGRIFWAAISEKIGRKPVFLLILGTQVPLLFILPHISSVVLFCVICCYIFACYGGGFAVMPSFAAETFGPKNIGSIYGKILLAWGLGGIVGPMNIEWSGTFSKALAISGCTLLVGFVIATLYRKPRLAPLPLDMRVGTLAATAKASDAVKQ